MVPLKGKFCQCFMVKCRCLQREIEDSSAAFNSIIEKYFMLIILDSVYLTNHYFLPPQVNSLPPHEKCDNRSGGREFTWGDQ